MKGAGSQRTAPKRAHGGLQAGDGGRRISTLCRR
ncbi:hypothetical protein KPB2_5525 [Klebsiella pneumoniae Kb677]|nr:hypothetical protein KPB2_5525 [Klebsiella pneumoniae Kb677]